MTFTVVRDQGAITARRSAVIAAARPRAAARVNNWFGAARRLFITDLPGQEMLYLEKRAQAEAFMTATLAGETISDTDDRWRLVRRDIGRFGVTTAYESAQLILNNAYAWRTIADEMEGIRGPIQDALLEASSFAEIAVLEQTAKGNLSYLLNVYGGISEDVIARLFDDTL